MNCPVNIITEMPLYVKKLFYEHGNPHLVYHNLEHTQAVVRADTYHLGTPDFEHLDALLWQERKLYTNTQIDNHFKQSLHFLLSHLYFTDYCRNLLTEGKEKNIALLKKKMQKKK